IQKQNVDCFRSLAIDDSRLRQPEDLKQLWNTEYSSQSTIPSSRRISPSKALVQLAENYTLSADKALDLGCGNVRNAFYLADRGISVTAVDFSQSALELLEMERQRQFASATISHINRDIREGLPIDSSSMDLVLDSYCLCHFVNDDERRSAMAEVYRI